MNTKIFPLVLIISLLSFGKSFTMSESYEKTIYNGCYPNSKKYIGAERAQQYCICTIKMLSSKYTDADMDRISKQNEEYQLKAFNFASVYCNDNTNAF